MWGQWWPTVPACGGVASVGTPGCGLDFGLYHSLMINVVEVLSLSVYFLALGVRSLEGFNSKTTNPRTTAIGYTFP